IGVLEQIVAIREVTLPIQMHDIRTRDPDSRLLQHVDLDRNVGKVLLLLRVRRLYLGEVEAAFLWREDVDRNKRVVGEEAGFEDRRRTVIDELAGALG